MPYNGPFDTARAQERCILVGIDTPQSAWDLEASLEELSRLASYRLGQAGLQGGRLGAHGEQAQAEERQAACHG